MIVFARADASQSDGVRYYPALAAAQALPSADPVFRLTLGRLTVGRVVALLNHDPTGSAVLAVSGLIVGSEQL